MDKKLEFYLFSGDEEEKNDGVDWNACCSQQSQIDAASRKDLEKQSGIDAASTDLRKQNEIEMKQNKKKLYGVSYVKHSWSGCNGVYSICLVSVPDDVLYMFSIARYTVCSDICSSRDRLGLNPLLRDPLCAYMILNFRV